MSATCTGSLWVCCFQPPDVAPPIDGAFHLANALRHRLLLRKEVIQPQVPLRLPCYDFIPITTHTLDGSLPCGLVHRLWVQTAFMM